MDFPNILCVMIIMRKTLGTENYPVVEWLMSFLSKVGWRADLAFIKVITGLGCIKMFKLSFEQVKIKLTDAVDLFTTACMFGHIELAEFIVVHLI